MYDGGSASYRITTVVPLSDAYIDYVGICRVAPVGQLEAVEA